MEDAEFNAAGSAPDSSEEEVESDPTGGGESGEDGEDESVVWSQKLVDWVRAMFAEHAPKEAFLSIKLEHAEWFAGTNLQDPVASGAARKLRATVWREVCRAIAQSLQLR